jgi:N6-adenosine-specific RNA methylase IME4
VERKVAVKEGRPANPTSPPLPAGQYSLILADPPWRYDFSNTNGRAVELHYPTMAPESISALPVRDLAAPDCVLFLWATYPLLREALSVVEAWGFTYKSQLVWVKDKIGLGFYCRAQHELLLVATRGEPGAPEPANRPPSVIHAPRGRHSEKPETAYEIIEQMFPRARRVELFSRRHRPGWTAWGNEAPPPSVTNGSVN